MNGAVSVLGSSPGREHGVRSGPPPSMNTVVEGNDLCGTTLDGRYRLIQRLGEGAMGQVYVAHHEGLDHRVAVKVLHPWLAREDKHRKRFLREARAAKRIRHPNVVEVLDCGTTDADSVYLVMELLEGRDLRAVLQAEGALPWSRARNLLLQGVAALREAHRQDVIHRDIKPANCFVCTTPDPSLPERMKLLDFGIAKVGGDPSASATGGGGKRLTQTGELVGTLAYMAPEFADGKPASVHTDMYALGIMAYQLLTGDVPFTGRNEFQVLARHLNEPPVRPRMLVPELPEAVEVVVLTLLAKKPEHRFESMADVEQAMLAIPGDADGGPIVVPHGRDSSGSQPIVRRRESTKPPVGRIRSLTPSRPIEAGEPVRSVGVRDDDDGFGPMPDQSNMPDSDVWEMGEPIDFNAAPQSTPVTVDEDDDDLKDELPGREWGTTATVILLVLLSAAAIASVVLRQRGIELHEIPWPWSDTETKAPAEGTP